MNNQEEKQNLQMEDKQDRKRWWHGFSFGVLCSAILFVIFCLVAAPSAITALKPGGLSRAEAESLVNKVDLLLRTLEDQYLEEFDEEKLMDGLYHGMVSAVGDQYTRYYTAEEYQDYRSDTAGQYVGIGISVRLADSGGARVVELDENGPAKAAGLQIDDILIEADGTDLTPLTLTEMVAIIKGEEGTSVEITYERAGVSHTVSIERSTIDNVTVKSELLEEGIGYISISGFEEVTTGQFQNAIAALKEQSIQGLIVDLRNNLGGRVDVVQKVTDELLPAGIITYTEDKHGERQVYESQDDPNLDLPLVVLVNGSSASASEIMAGAIQDRGAGILVGTTTYGKGIVQLTTPFSDGTAIKVTMAKYYTPNGNYIHGIGIKPDIYIELPEGTVLSTLAHEDDIQLQTALEAMRTQLGR